jgi:Undecaprenyl-phosphate glucose phosphotransferase
MLRRRLDIMSFSLRVVILLLPALAFAIAYDARFLSGMIHSPYRDINRSAYGLLLVCTTVVWAIAADHYKLTQVNQLFASHGKARQVAFACLATYAVVLTTIFFYRESSFSRLFIALSAPALFVLALAARFIFRLFLTRGNRGAQRSIRILIIGVDEYADSTARSLLAGQVMPCKIVGFVRLPGQETHVSGAPVHEMSDIQKLAINNGIDDIVVALPPARFAELQEIFSLLEILCAPVRATLDFGKGIVVQPRLLNFGGMVMLDLQSTSAESVAYTVFKRVFDVVFSAIVILLTAPILLAIAIVIRLTSPGPVLFIQERVGLNGELFRMYKFRTMRVCKKNESDTRWTTPEDPRRTRFGAFLRRTSLDELPQFFNVLKGEMSVVGPRPERPFFVKRFLEDVALYNKRHYMKVGITGWAQVNGLRGDSSIAKRVEHDLYYLRNWSLSFDLQIIILTLLRGFRDGSAY